MVLGVQVCQELERQAERAKLVNSHSGLDLEYLKNIMLKLYETGRSLAATCKTSPEMFVIFTAGSKCHAYLPLADVKAMLSAGESAALLPVLSTVLKFSPAELRRCQSGLSAAADRADSQQTATARTAVAFDASAADSAGYITGWTSWAFGGEPSTR